MNKREKSILTAICIGDGYIRKDPKSKGCHLSIVHSIKQKPWILEKYSLLISILGGHKPKIVEFNNSGYPGIRFTKSHKYFRVLHKWLYKNGKKTISKNILNKLDEHGLAIWYMDDGGLSAKKKNGKIHAYDLFINTHISREENQIIIDYFSEKWGINFKPHKNKGFYRLRIGTMEARKFIRIIEPYIIPSMEYKIAISKKL